MLTRDSRYVEAGLYKRFGEPTIRIRYIDRRRLPGTRFYTVREGDTLDLIAYRAYGDPKWWWVIADVNPEVGLAFPVGKLRPGLRIAIPPLEPVIIRLREALR